MQASDEEPDQGAEPTGQGASAPGPPSPLHTLACWLIIIAAIVAMAGTREVQLSRMAEQGADASQLMGIEIAGRIAIGMKTLTEKASPKAVWKELNISPQMQADYPIRTAILYGEVIGAERALKQLDLSQPAGHAPDAALVRRIYAQGPNALSPEQRRHLDATYGWFAKLALTHDQPATSPARHEALHPAVVAAWAMIGLLLFGGLALVVGLVLLVLAFIFFTGGTVHSFYTRPEHPSGPLLEAFTIYLGGMGLVLLGISHFWHHAPIALRLAIYFALPFAAFWPLLRGVSWTQLRQQLGWHMGKGLFHEIGAGITGYVTFLPVLFVGLLISGALIRTSGQPATHPISQFTERGGLMLVGVYLLACVFAPLAEETLFRGALYTHLRGRWGWIVSALVVAFIFAIIHPQGWVALPVLGTFAFASASIREWRSSIVGCMTAHALNNACAITLLVLLLR